MHIDISSDIDHSMNTNNNHNAWNPSDEDPQPANRRKPRSASTVTPTTSRGHAPRVHVRQPGPFVALSTATPKIDDAQLQVDYESTSMPRDPSEARLRH
ncbi:hypothetical protein ACMFMF_004801 [Clarireedia jacksonii]